MVREDGVNDDKQGEIIKNGEDGEVIIKNSQDGEVMVPNPVYPILSPAIAYRFRNHIYKKERLSY